MALIAIAQTQGRFPVTIFRLRERIHLGNFSELEHTAQKNYDDGMRNLVMDLSEVDTLTSIGLRAIVVVHKILARSDNGKHLKLAGATAVMREIMQVTGISQFIEIYDTVDEAVASF